jgi:hypothetical protein
MKTFADFMEAVGLRENSGKYETANSTGSYLGRYQFGKPRLKDLGIITYRDTWAPGLSEFAFLHNPKLQDACFTASIARYARMIRRVYPILPLLIGDIDMTLSGACAVCHLLGPGGLAKWYAGEDPVDGLGTPASEYMTLFADYEIPEDLPIVVPAGLRCP